MTRVGLVDASGKRVGVLGTLVWDTIHHPARRDAPPLEQWGGIAYSLSAFAAAGPPGWTIVPLIRVGADLAAEVHHFLDSLPGIGSRAGVRVVDEPTNRVELRYYDDAERTEQLTGGVSGWSWAELQPHLADLDALYVNYISGYELELDTALTARRAVTGPIYADLHSLFLGPPGQGHRRPRPLPRADRWLQTADYVQVNDLELALLQGGGEDGSAGIGRVDAHLQRTHLLVTRGPRGATWIRSRGQEAEEVAVPLPDGPLPGDPTGCGDVWGAVVMCALLEGRRLPEAMLSGHRAAAAKLGRPRMEGLSPALALALASTADS